MFLFACVGLPPNKDYNLAKSALDMARKHGAEWESPEYYRKAVSFYKAGQAFFEEKLYGKAEDQFLKSRRYSEKAENIIRLKKYSQGDFSN